MPQHEASARWALPLTLAIGGCATTTSPTGRTQHVGGGLAAAAQPARRTGLRRGQGARNRKAPTRARPRTCSCVVGALVRELPAEALAAGWETAVFVDQEPNAFALPGGKVGVNTGIFTVARNQDQLAAVIAHEIGHVISRHHDERITRQMGAQAAARASSARCWARVMVRAPRRRAGARRQRARAGPVPAARFARPRKAKPTSSASS